MPDNELRPPPGPIENGCSCAYQIIGPMSYIAHLEASGSIGAAAGDKQKIGRRG